MFRLPNEGLTIEYLFQPVSAILLQPIITSPLLALASRYPDALQQLISRFAHDRIAPATVKTGLGWLVALGLIYRTNKYLNRRAFNNWSTDKTWDWTKEIVVVTGGSSGMGELYVRKLQDKGVKVASLDINEPRTKLSGSAHFFKTDITSPNAIRETAVKIRETLGEPTVLINNAGLGGGFTILDEKEERIRKLFEVNTISHFWLVREFLPYMIKRNHGHVVTISSAAGFVSVAANTVYCGTKASALAFNEGLAQELKHRYKAPKVRTTVVHPSFVRTPMIDYMFADKKFTDFVLSPETVVDTVLEQVYKGEAAQIILPKRFAGILTTLRGLPLWLSEAVRDGQKDMMVEQPT